MSRIRVLPEAVASRIAAGEVVERPASIVKELVENALDAGARRIEVTLEEGGKRLVRVTDDGGGMDADDALMAFQQHATSKVGADFDLSSIGTHGFRGEALPAIAACSAVTLVTACSDGQATRVRVEHGTLRDVAQVGAPRGTSVEVTRLFATLPARRKFLRTAATELSHALRFIEQQAMGRPDVHFVLTQGRPLLELTAVPDEAARVRQVLGSDLVEQAVVVAGEADGLRVRAWIVPGGSGPGRLAQSTILVNGRAVADRVLSHALREATRQLLGDTQAPAGVLLVDLPASEVDVNVHPAKREVRFARPGRVHDVVRDLLRADAFQAGAFAPAMTGAPPASVLRQDVVPRPPSPRQSDFGASVAERWAGGAASPREPSPSSPIPRGLRVLGQHRNTYVVLEDEQGLVLVDQHCAHERILFERVMRSLHDAPARQALLSPVVVDVPPSHRPRLAERLDDLLALGFEVEEFGEGTFAVRAMPAAAGAADVSELLRELAAQDIPASEPLERLRRLAATVACKAAVKAGFPLGAERLRWIVEELWKADVPTTCPHGRVAVLRLSDRDLDHRFGRT